MNEKFPLLPFRSALYRPRELFAGFDPRVEGSYATTPDFAAYRSTWLHAERPDRDVGMLRALHDQCITEARDDLLLGHRVVAIMGGHAMARDDAAYRVVVDLAAELARRDFMVVSGGGPGAMEASHLGALLSAKRHDVLADAVAHLKTAADFPDSAAGLVSTGALVNQEAMADLHAWQRPSFEVLADVAEPDRVCSLAVPTWFYGHEPPTPFATDIAKYFTNAIREDGLLAIAVDGVIFSPGKAGTLQEIFQDACQNYYRTFNRRFSPMAFLDHERCWTETFPIEPLLRPLFGDEFDRHVRIDADPDVLLRFLLEHDPDVDLHPRSRPAGPISRLTLEREAAVVANQPAKL